MGKLVKTLVHLAHDLDSVEEKMHEKINTKNRELDFQCNALAERARGLVARMKKKRQPSKPAQEPLEGKQALRAAHTSHIQRRQDALTDELRQIKIKEQEEMNKVLLSLFDKRQVLQDAVSRKGFCQADRRRTFCRGQGLFSSYILFPAFATVGFPPSK